VFTFEIQRNIGFPMPFTRSGCQACIFVRFGGDLTLSFIHSLINVCQHCYFYTIHGVGSVFEGCVCVEANTHTSLTAGKRRRRENPM